MEKRGEGEFQFHPLQALPHPQLLSGPSSWPPAPLIPPERLAHLPFSTSTESHPFPGQKFCSELASFAEACLDHHPSLIPDPPPHAMYSGVKNF